MTTENRKLIFINYRGADQIWAVEAVYARMTDTFGAQVVFKAGNSIRAGQDFPPQLRRHAASCPVMLVCIGPGWLTAGGPEGRALDRRDDWVRKEIKLSLKAGNHLVPLLIGNHDQVSIPRPEQVPKAIRDLVRRQAWRLAPGGGLDLAVAGLAARLAELVPELAELAERRSAAGAKPGAGPTSAAATEGPAPGTYKQQNTARDSGTVFAVQHGTQNVGRPGSTDSAASPGQEVTTEQPTPEPL